MEEDHDPFLEDEDTSISCTDGFHCEPSEDENEEKQNPLRSSPILNASGVGHKFSNNAGRKSRLRRSRSGAFPGPRISFLAAQTLENLKIPPSSPSEELLLPQDQQPDFIAPKTPSLKVLERNAPQNCGADSDEDIFASSMCDEQTCDEERVTPSALSALLNNPEPSDLSWTSSMATPLASNATWSNLNTEERKVLLPSDDCNLVVKPRALFSPDLNDTAEFHLLNASSDAEYLQALKGEKTAITPKFRGRKNPLMSKTPMESPLASVLVPDITTDRTPSHKLGLSHDPASRGSPILSGSNEFTKTSIEDKGLQEEDLFNNEEEYLKDMLPCNQTSGVKHSKVAESTPNILVRKRSPADNTNQSLIPRINKPSNAESFLGDISVTALEEVCQAQERKDASLPPVATPEKQPDTKRKRLLFSTNPGVSNSTKTEFKIPEAKDKEVNSFQGNLTEHCIPDDSFMEHLAAMNTSIFSDAMQPVTKVQSIKSSVSQMKTFCYSVDQKPVQDQNSGRPPSTSEPQSVMKEILSSVIALESSSSASLKSKFIKSSGDLVVFSQLEAEIGKEPNHKEEKNNVILSVEDESKLCTSKPTAKVEEALKDSAHSPCKGFQTDVDNHVTVSQEALCKGLNIWKDTLEDAEMQESTSLADPPVVTQERQETTKPANFNDDQEAEEVKQLLQLVSDGEDFHPWPETEQLFSANSEKASYSQEKNHVIPLSSVNHVSSCRNTSSNNGMDRVSANSPSIGFSTASGKGVTVSEAALKKVRNLFDNLPEESSCHVIEKPAMKNNELSKCIGFSTADRRRVNVSEKTMNQAKNLFKDISESDPDQSKAFVKTPALNAQRTLGSASNPRPSPLLKAQQVVPKITSESFTTASGKTEAMSREALYKVKGVFDNITKDSVLDLKTSTDSLSTRDVPTEGFSTACKKNLNLSKEALDNVEDIFDNLNQPNKSNSYFQNQQHIAPHCSDVMLLPKKSFCSEAFSTASGRTVNVSKEDLIKVKGLFDSGDLPIESHDLSSSTFSKARIFSTSSEGLLKSPTTSNQFTLVAGFSTAGGTTVHISKQALNKAKTLFDDIPSETFNSQEESSIIPSAREKAGNIVEDDSGVFISHDNTRNESFGKSRSLQILPNTHSSLCGDNKNQIFSSGVSSVQQLSLTQEITESTAAILADDDFFDTAQSIDGATNSRQTISTSPSMVTDRFSNLKPILSSASENKRLLSEPKSPILMKSASAGPRNRPRRGRLSLCTNSDTRSLSPTLGSQPVPRSQIRHKRMRLSLPSQISSSDVTPMPLNAIVSNGVTEINRSSSHENVSCPSNESKLNSKLSPSRKLFADKTDWSPAKLETPKPGSSFNEPLKIEATTNRTFDPEDVPSTKPPLMRKSLTKGRSGQSSGFKTPYKHSTNEVKKRSPSSPAQNPPEAKRMKPSSNLYVSHIYLAAEQTTQTIPRVLRPEVAVMRKRAEEEQRQLVKNHAEHKGELLRPCVGSWLSGKIQFSESSKKLLKMVEMGTPVSYSSSDLAKIGLKSSTLSVTADSSAEFRFSAWDYYSEDVCRENVAGLPVGDRALLVLDSQGSVGVEEFERSFLACPGVDPSLVPRGWIKNHYRWLVWKLAALEWRFPYQLGGRCLSPHILMLQLKYRYDREIDRCERPALRRILEQDDSAAKRMVLCVVCISNKEQEGMGLELELTDGWYSLTASIDQDMQHRVKKGIIGVGTKLIMHSAELINCSEGCHPLQVRPDVRLKIYSNSTRRARWHTKLGFQDNPGPLNVSLSSILSGGGLVSCVSAYVARVYPIAFMEKTQERTVVRSQRAESKEKEKFERMRQQLTEKVYSQVQAELQQEQNKRRQSAVKFSLKQLSTLTSGEELSEILENTSDPHSVQIMLSEEQKSIIADYQRTKQEELRSEMEARVRSRLSDNANNERQVTPVLKVRLFDSLNGRQSCAILSIWRPSEDLSSVFKEGHKMTFYGVVANGLRFGELQLSANRSTRYHADNASEINADLARSVSPLSSLSVHGTLPQFGELDVVGIVIRISPAPSTPQNTSHFQTVYLTDCQQNIISVLFREGMKEFGVEDLITPCAFIAASNLQWRGSAVVKAVPCIYASELSFFTTNPRQRYLQTALQDLRRIVTTDLNLFCRTCEDKLDNLLQLKVSSPAISDSVLSTSKLPEENSVGSKLSGQGETPPNVSSLPPLKAQRKLLMDQQAKVPVRSHSPAVEKRLAKLEAYGEPPPISPILISQSRRSLGRQFRPPRKTDSPSIDGKKSDKSSSDQI